jgi:type III secretion protein D
MIAGCKLKVLEGLHAGAELDLPDGTYIIGSDLQCDLVLLDPGVEKQHLRLHVENRRVNAERLGDARTEVRGALVASKAFGIGDGDVVRLGPAAFSLVVPRDAAAGHSVDGQALPETQDYPPSGNPQEALAGNGRRRIALALSILAFLVGTGAFIGLRAFEVPPAKAGAFSPADTAPLPATSGQDYAARVREFILDDRLDVRLDPNGRIVVSGTTQKAEVREQIARLQKEFAKSVEIVDRISYVLDKTPPNRIQIPQRIVDISMGSPRWFKTADGTRNFEGSTMADGAEVIRIGMNGIVFRRNGKLTVFPLNDKEQQR